MFVAHGGGHCGCVKVCDATLPAAPPPACHCPGVHGGDQVVEALVLVVGETDSKSIPGAEGLEVIIGHSAYPLL